MIFKELLFQKLVPWNILVASLVSIIWVVVMFANTANLQPSVWHLLLLVLTFLPGIFVVGFRRKILSKYIIDGQRAVSWVAGFILIISFFYVLEPFARFRIEIAHQNWLIGLPVVFLYAFLAIYWIAFVWTSRVHSSHNPQLKVSSNREVFIDFARGFAILLAVGSHAFYAFGYDVLFGDSMYQVMSLTRLATPSFVLITGIMFELVYLRKAEKAGFKATVQSLLIRAMQCYVVYVVTVFIEWFNQQLTTFEAQYAVLFMGNSLFSGILKFYALFLLLAIPIIWLRKRFGILVISVLPVIVWVMNIFFQQIPWPSIDQPVAYLTALLFGYPALSNFSVWHAITFMSFGMLVGFMIKRAKQVENWLWLQITLLVLFVLCAVVSLIAVLPTTWEDFYFNFSNEFRINHELPYYSIGSMGAFLLLWIIWKLRRFLRYPIWEHSVTMLGKDSLWAFAVGNSLAAVLPALYTQTWFVVLFIIAVLGGSVVIIHVKNLLSRSQEILS